MMIYKNILSYLCFSFIAIAGIYTDTASPVVPATSPLDRYLQLLDSYQSSLAPLGSWHKGEIEIITNVEQIKKIENQVRLRLLCKGASEQQAKDWSTVGVIAEDQYLMWLRDGVIFPSGVYGTYDRIIWKSGMSGAPGVAVMPVLANKKIVVNLNYRHATRSWEIELPRGERRGLETLEQAALRELKEETGYELSQPLLLGTMTPDSGILTSVIPLFYGQVCHSGESYREYSEAISQNPAFSKEELKAGLVRGYIDIPIQGNIVRVCCRDPHIAFALLLAESKKLL